MSATYGVKGVYLTNSDDGPDGICYQCDKKAIFLHYTERWELGPSPQVFTDWLCSSCFAQPNNGNQSELLTWRLSEFWKAAKALFKQFLSPGS